MVNGTRRCCRYKLKNIEETEAAKKLLQEKRLVGKTKSELSIPSSYSADYLQRGRDYAEKLRRGMMHLLKPTLCAGQSCKCKLKEETAADQNESELKFRIVCSG